jgi:hypothetical protein
MRALTKSEACDWCVAHRIPLDQRRLPQPNFLKSQRRDFDIPKDTGRRIALLHDLFVSFPTDEALLWITEWGVWPSCERPHMFERFKDSYGEYRSLSHAPAYVFSSAEGEDLISFVGFAVLFLWDCHVITAMKDTWLFLSHDENGWVSPAQINESGDDREFR